MDLIAINFLKVDRTAGGYEYILIIIDQFTRHGQAHATKSTSAKTAAEKLFNDFELKFGTTNRILHDQGKEFENNFLMNQRSILELRDAEQNPITICATAWLKLYSHTYDSHIIREIEI